MQQLTRLDICGGQDVRHGSEMTVRKMEVTDAMRDCAHEFVDENRFRHTETGVFVTPDAEDAKTFYQIAMNASKEPDMSVADITGDGGGSAYEINGRVYHHVELTEADGDG
jgi:hypothetical protein